MRSSSVYPAAIWLACIPLVLAASSAGAGDPVEQWPSSVSLLNETDNGNTFEIRGLYGNAAEWSRFSNRVARMFDKFAATDSLVVDTQSGYAYLTTLQSRLELRELVDWLAQYTGYVPTWAELVARDNRSDNFDRSLYRLLCHYETRGLESGYRHCGAAVTYDGTVELRFYDNPHPAGSVRSYLLKVGWNRNTGPTLDFSLADSLSRKDLYALDDFTEPAQSRLLLAEGAEGVVRLNESTAHCKGEMRYSLRVLDPTGLSVWAAEEDIYGRCGVWAADLSGNGEDEIVVMAHEHGRVHVFVYGS